MANLPESTSYDAGIYQLETTDPVLGGATGVANTQGKGLANRTNWLKSKVNTALRVDSFVSTSAPYTISAADVSKVLFISNMGNSGFTFPSAAAFPQNQPFTIMAADQSVFKGVTFTPNGTDKFFDGSVSGGSASYTIRPGQRLNLVAIGTTWYIIGNAQSEKNGRIPAGACMPFAAITAPSGWLKCNGAAVSRTVYADLFAAIATVWGVGDGSTTFNIPDYRGVFVRGLDEGAGLDTGRTIGVYQADSFKSHTHGIPNLPLLLNDTDRGLTASNFSIDNVDNSRITQPTGGNETVPKNFPSPYIIKY